MSHELRKASISAADGEIREAAAYCEHFNRILKLYTLSDDHESSDLSSPTRSSNGTRINDISAYLPLTPEVLFERLRDGVLLAYMLHYHFPGCIDPRSLVHNMDLTQMDREGSKVTFQVHGNLSTVVAAAKTVPHLVIVNLGPHDILDMKKDLVMGLLWQILNAKLADNLSVKQHPELLQLAHAGEDPSNVASLRPEAVLLRWINFQLQNAGISRRVRNLSSDVSDSIVYATVMNQVAPKCITRDDVKRVESLSAEDQQGLMQRAALVVEFAERLDCRQFVTAQDIVSGHQRLNFCFVATLFNAYPNLSTVSRAELESMEEQIKELQSQLELSLLDQEKVQKQLLLAQEKSEQLEDQLNAEREKYEAELTIKEETMKKTRQDLADEYSASVAGVLEQERRRHDDEMWTVLGRQQKMRQALTSMARELRLASKMDAQNLQVIPEAVQSASSDSLRALDDGLEGVVQSLQTTVDSAVATLKTLKETTIKLNSSVQHKERLNEVMGEKIKAFAEGAAQSKQQESQRRASILKRIFH